jgi:glycosyltransferase involved in cell wall biosynthesis
MKNILLFIDSLMSGGAERQMAYLATGLNQEGHKVYLVVFSHEKEFYDDYIEQQGLQVIHNSFGINRFKRIISIAKLVREYHPDVVITYKDGVCIAACLAKFFTRFNLIVSERNTTQQLNRYEKTKFALYRLADKIVPNSYSQGRFIAENYPYLKSKVSVITNMIDFDKFNSSLSFPKDNGIIIVVTVARVMPQKNMLNYLKAIQMLENKIQNVQFTWYGAQVEPYYSEVRDYIDGNKLSSYVQFLPPQKDIQEVYRKADIFCLPSIYEGFPNVICEAMACGLPVVCSRICDNPDIVEDGVNGYLFDPNSVEDIAENLLRMIQLSGKNRVHMGQGNANKVKELCARESFLKAYNELFS